MKTTMKTIQCLLLLASSALLGGRASAVVVCSVSSTGAAFGAFDPVSGNLKDTLGTISVSCTGSPGDAVNYTIALSPGAGTVTSRDMQAGASNVFYNLFTNGSHTVIWGDGTGGTGVVSDNYTLAVSPTVRSYTVYGEIPPQSGPTVGSYLDNVVITVNF